MEFNPDSRKSDYFLQIIALVGTTLLPLTLLFLVWALQRGLNISDESMALVSSQHPDDVKFGLTSYHLYTSLLFSSVGQNIITVRLIRLAMTIFAGSIFYVGLNSVISHYQIETGQAFFYKASRVSCLCLGAMIAYSWFLPALEYNALNSFSVTVSSGLILLLTQWPEKISTGTSLRYRSILISIGLCIGLSFFVKFTTGLLLFLLYSFIISINAERGIKDKVNCLLIILSGIFVWLLVHFLFIQSPVLWLRYFSNGLQLAATMSIGYDSSSVSRYFHEAVKSGKSAFGDYWILHLTILLGLSLIHRFKRSIKSDVQLIAVLFGAVFVVAAALSIHRQLYIGGQGQWFNLSRFYLGWLLLLLNAVMASFGYNLINGAIIPKQKIINLLQVGVLLFCLPFAGAIGSAAPLYLSILISMAPWFGLLVLLATLLAWLHQIRWIAPLLIVLFSVFACAQITTGSLFDPYRLPTGLLEQTQATEIGYPPTVLKLDPISSEFYTKIKVLAQKNGFKPGDDILAFYDLPGVVYALGGRSPALSWYFGNIPAPAATAEKALSIADPKRLKSAFILQSAKSERIMPDLGKFGLNFPTGYKLCGEIYNPNKPSKGIVRLWKPL